MSSGSMVVVAAAAAAQVPLPLPPDAGYVFDIETKVAIDASFAAFICIARSLGTPFGAVRLASDPVRWYVHHSFCTGGWRASAA